MIVIFCGISWAATFITLYHITLLTLRTLVVLLTKGTVLDIADDASTLKLGGIRRALAFIINNLVCFWTETSII